MIFELQEQEVEVKKIISASTASATKHLMISGLKMKIIHFLIKLTLIKVVISCYRSPLDWFKALRYLLILRKQFIGNHKLNKMVFSGGKYYMGLYTPGWNGTIYNNFVVSQLNDFKLVKNINPNRFNTIFVAITKKCTLQCEHCYEWENLNKKEVLTEKDLQDIINKIQVKGVSQIQLSGGEPLLKMNTLINILNNSKKKSNFWVVTSGFKLTDYNAKRLKDSGLTGVIISLDHYIPEKHNKFRHFKDAFYWVEEAVKNANSHNLVTALSLCATKEFISEKNLMEYMELAKKLQVSFVQILDPKAVGHYVNKDVLLEESHFKIIDEFFLKMNFNSKYSTYPLISYHGYHQRRLGCYSAGIKGLYVDTDGNLNACPFCHKKTGNVLDLDFDKNLEILKSEGCSNYKTINS